MQPTLAEYWRMSMDLLNQHLPSQLAWTPIVGLLVAALLGGGLMLHGARLARGLFATVLLLMGGIGGYALAPVLATPVWPTAALAAIGGAALGFVLFRIVLAGVTMGLFASLAIGAYTLFGLAPHLAHYTSDGLDADSRVVSLPAAGAVVGATPPFSERFAHLWNYLSTHAPRFELTFYGLLFAALCVGGLCAWRTPRLARALAAATGGTFLFGLGCAGMMEMFAPAALQWLLGNDGYAWGIVGATWLASLIWNLLACRKLAAQKPAAESAAAPAAKPSLA
ncbi:MAG: hypothetical protein AB7Q17_09695 [Phycisphaerae bacterium]